ncbi:MAG: 30S ribosomal protein S16 [Clostridia bacterium]|nr:30S ribosomal protein S16 [Clostridia bacterium]
MVKLRLTRMGAKKQPFYRIVAIDSRKARDGEYIEQIGYYNPAVSPKVVVIDAEIAKKWLANGAQPTETVKSLFKANGIID